MISTAINDVLRHKWSKLDAVPPGWDCDDALAFFLLAAFDEADHEDELLAILRDAEAEIRRSINAVIAAMREEGES